MFKDRYDAAHQLVSALGKYKDNPDVVIIAIPRGALEIGYILAKELHAPLDIVLSKKIGAPGQPELAIGAVSLDAVYINPRYQNVPDIQEYVEKKRDEIRALLKKRAQEYRKSKPAIDLKDKIVIVTDDGIATGKTLLATLKIIEKQQPKKIIVAVPVGPRDTIEALKKNVDEVVCLLEPESFFAVGQFYQQFDQVDDEEAIRLLHEAQK